MLSTLVKEPFSLPLGQAARLTLYQVFQVYLVPDPARHEEQRFQPQGQPVFMSAFELFWEDLARKGVDDAEIVARWQTLYPSYADQAVIDPHWRADLEDDPHGR